MSVITARRRPIDEQQDRGRPAAEVLAQVAAGGEPRHRVGHAQHHGILAGGVQEVADPLMLRLDVVPPAPGSSASPWSAAGSGSAGRVSLIGAVRRGVQDAVEFHRQVEGTGNRRTQTGEVEAVATNPPPQTNRDAHVLGSVLLT